MKSQQQLEKELEVLRMERDALAARVAARDAGTLRVRFNNSTHEDGVEPKRGFSVLGLNSRFPLTLYASQWVRLAEFLPVVLDTVAQYLDVAAIKDHEDRDKLAERLEALTAKYGVS